MKFIISKLAVFLILIFLFPIVIQITVRIISQPITKVVIIAAGPFSKVISSIYVLFQPM